MPCIFTHLDALHIISNFGPLLFRVWRQRVATLSSPYLFRIIQKGIPHTQTWAFPKHMCSLICMPPITKRGYTKNSTGIRKKFCEMGKLLNIVTSLYEGLQKITKLLQHYVAAAISSKKWYLGCFSATPLQWVISLTQDDSLC